MLAVIQFSDLHVVCDGERDYGGLGPDTGATWHHAVDQAFAPDIPLPDRVVVTGDIASHGAPDEYRLAAQRLNRLPVSVNVLTGNHDVQAIAEAHLPSGVVSMNRAERHGPWLFVYVDTNAVMQAPDQGSEIVDHPLRETGRGGISRRERARIDALIEASDAEYIWLWCHHTPNASGSFANEAFSEQVASLVRSDSRIRGVGSGHVHNNDTPSIGGVPVLVCPSMTLNFDVHEWCTLPPAYREYNFSFDGSVHSEVVWVPYPGFQSVELPDPVVSHLKGLISYTEMQAELG